MCKKQCKDGNGFKCHCNTEHHKQLMKLLAENPQYYINKYSEEFEASFLSLLRSKYLNTSVDASKVYSQFAYDKYNVKLNSTKWTTLTSFLQYLADTGKCQLNKIEKGWTLLCVDNEKEFTRGREERDKEAVRRKEIRREEKRLQKLMKRADKLIEDQTPEVNPTPLVRKDNEAITIEINAEENDNNDNQPIEDKKTIKKTELNEKEKEFEKFIKQKEKEDSSSKGKKRQNEKEYWERELAEFIEEKKKKEEKEENKKPEEEPGEIPWIIEGIVVKVIDQNVGRGKYYNKKAAIKKVHGEYIAEIKMVDSGDIMKIDQANLETVVPSIGGQVLLLIGKYRGKKGIMRGLHIDEYKGSIEVSKDKVLKIPYEGFSKVA